MNTLSLRTRHVEILCEQDIIYPFIHSLQSILIWVTRMLEPIPATLAWGWYTLDVSPIWNKDNTKDRHPFILIFIPVGNLESPNDHTPLTAYLWTVGESQRTQREPTQIWGEHANSTKKGPSQMLESYSGLSCSEATVLTTMLPYDIIYTLVESKSTVFLNRTWILGFLQAVSLL